MDIKLINNKILQSCTYILTNQDTEAVYLVDCGESDPIIEYIEREHKQLRGVFLTHCHYDHIYGLNAIIEKYPYIMIYGSAKALNGLSDPDINLSWMYDDGDYIVTHNIVIRLEEGSSVDILGERIEVVTTPGHSEDCLTYIANDIIFTGDSYNPDFPVFTKWQDSSEEESVKSINRIKSLIKEKNLTVYPGHYK